jgi:hypothetical protein
VRVTRHPHAYPARHDHGLPLADLRWLQLAQPAIRTAHLAPGGWVAHPVDQPCVDCEVTR